jgi:mannose-6-phosphate isomerase
VRTGRVSRKANSMSSIERAIDYFRSHPTLLELQCGVQHYDWGSFDAIPRLLHKKPVEHHPYAELWMGAHPDLPAKVVIQGQVIPLHRLIDGAAETVLGQETAERFHRQLPFLFKVLSARKPLSIQAHPSKQKAEEGFARENALNIAITDKNRNYKDSNHKPEMIAALTDFYALSGFRPLDEIAATLTSIPEFRGLAADFEPTTSSLKRLYGRLLSLPQQQVNAVLTPFVERLTKENAARPFDKDDFAYWVLVADRAFSRHIHKDRGLFSVCLLNLVHLVPGQAMYQPAGVLHGYLQGTGLEVMANSNNVLRGGLTSKHVDVKELLRIMDFASGRPNLVAVRDEEAQPAAAVYQTPVEEFELARLHICERQHRCGPDHGVHITIVIEGNVCVSTSDGTNTQFSSGRVFLVPSPLSYEISSESDAVLFQARTKHSPTTALQFSDN